MISNPFKNSDFTTRAREIFLDCEIFHRDHEGKTKSLLDQIEHHLVQAAQQYHDHWLKIRMEEYKKELSETVAKRK